MTPEEIVKADKDAGLETPREVLPSDGDGLKVPLVPETTAASTEITTAKGQDKNSDMTISAEDHAIETMVDMLPQLFREVSNNLDENREIAHKLQKHYAEMAINNQESDISTNADELAKGYLQEMIKVDSEKKDLVKSIATMITKKLTDSKKKKKKTSGDVMVAGDNNTINLFGKSRRQLLEDLNHKTRVVDADSTTQTEDDK